MSGLSEWLKTLKNWKPKTEPLQDNISTAKQFWDDRIGIGIHHARNWRIMAFFLVVLCILLSSGLIYQSSKSQIQPYIIHIDADGNTEKIIKADQMQYLPVERDYRSKIYRVIKLLRELSTDKVVMEKNYQESKYYLLNPAVTWVTAEFENNGPMKKFNEQTRSVEIKVVNKLSEETFRAEWIENIFDMDGSPLERYKMSGIFKMTLVQPKTELDLFINPIGIRIESLNWTKEL